MSYCFIFQLDSTIVFIFSYRRYIFFAIIETNEFPWPFNAAETNEEQVSSKAYFRQELRCRFVFISNTRTEPS